MEKYYYLLIMIATISGPFLMSFEKKIRFIQYFKSFLYSNLFTALYFILWDINFTSKGIWSFNESYIIGIKLANLPIEEISFFVLVPYACLFIYENISHFVKLTTSQTTHTIYLLVGLVAMIVSYPINLAYTSSALLLMGFLLVLTSSLKLEYLNRAVLAYIVCLIPFMIVNGLLTAIPIVIYNNSENLGFRIYTIPVEDIVYGFDLYLMNLIIYEKLKLKLNQQS